MTGPTYNLTERVSELLEEPVTLALRVRSGPGSNEPLLGGTRTAWEGLRMHPVFRPLGSLLSRLLQSLRDRWSGTTTFTGILALADGGDRILLGRRRFRSLQPTQEIRRLREGAPLLIDKELYDNFFIAELVVANEHFIVHPVDFRVLLKEVVAGRVDAPEIKHDLADFYVRQKQLASVDPDVIRERTKRKFFFKSPSDKTG